MIRNTPKEPYKGLKRTPMKRKILSPPKPRPHIKQVYNPITKKYYPVTERSKLTHKIESLWKKTPIRKVSKKQAKRNKLLAEIPMPEDGKCQNCHNLPDFRGLQKHHIQLRSLGGKDNPENLVWCCGKCHHNFHHIYEQ